MRALLLLALILGCKDKDAGDSATTATGESCAADIAFNELVKTAVTFSWTSSTAGVARVEYGLQGNLDQSVTAAESATEHSVQAIALAHGGTYTLQAVVTTDAGDEVRCDAQEFEVPQAPQEIQKFTVNISEPESEMANGYVLLSTLGSDSTWVGLLSGTGRYHFTAGSDADNLNIARARMGRDGTSVIYNYAHDDRIDDLGGLARVSLDGSVNTRTRTLVGHHDFIELPDGTLSWLGYDRRNIAMPSVDALKTTPPIVQAESAQSQPTVFWRVPKEWLRPTPQPRSSISSMTMRRTSGGCVITPRATESSCPSTTSGPTATLSGTSKAKTLITS
ncbi:MAG: hypothetical protein GWP91_21255 [Rhodobacterales bacterium]|nr:hypothetical protein [Rhodobacterales bacterium]